MRKWAILACVLLVFTAGAVALNAHYRLTPHPPQDMPTNSLWIQTGRDRATYERIGLWAACWKSAVKPVDHCRITDQIGTASFDGDMLPLNSTQPLADQELKLGVIDPAHLWVRGVNRDMPVPVLPLANRTLLVPVSDRDGLQRRMALGQWSDGLDPARPALAQH